jgi:hypothetical protein
MKTFEFKRFRIHFYLVDARQIDLGISISYDYVEISLFKICVEIDWFYKPKKYLKRPIKTDQLSKSFLKSIDSIEEAIKPSKK